MVVELCEEDNDWVRDTVSVRVGRVRVAVEVTEGVTVRDCERVDRPEGA